MQQTGHLPACLPPFAVAVRHCLLALPGVEKGEIKRVLSHPQALAQTDSYTRRMPGVVRQAVDDTGGPAGYRGGSLYCSVQLGTPILMLNSRY